MRHRAINVAAAAVALATLTVVALVAGCDSSATDARVLRVPGDAVEVSAVAVLEGNLATFRYNSGYGERARLVVRTAAEWSQAWARITEGSFPRPPEPAVDFRQDMVVLVARGAARAVGIPSPSRACTKRMDVSSPKCARGQAAASRERSRSRSTWCASRVATS
jgi:hypothetical protein